MNLHPRSPSQGVDVLAMGEALLLFHTRSQLTSEQVSVGLAGAEVNALASTARLGMRAALLTRLGADIAGESVLTQLEMLGIETTWTTSRPDQRTGVQLRRTSSGDERLLVNYREASAASQMDAEDVDRAVAAARPRAFLVSGLTAALGPGPRRAVYRAARLAAEQEYAFMLDVNLRQTLPGYRQSVRTVREVIPAARVIFMGLDEGEVVFGERDPERLLRAIREVSRADVVLKGGAEGCWISEADSELVRLPALATMVVDTVGAGDGFAGGYVVARLAGYGVRDAGLVGSLVASRVLSQEGDQWRPGRDWTIDELRTEAHDILTGKHKDSRAGRSAGLVE